jgi:hypothetical protein
MAETTYQRLARTRFPHFAISGDGEYALVCRDNGRVLLSSWPLMLHAELIRDTTRRIVRLEPQQQSKSAGRRTSSNNTADRERD